MVVQQAGSNLRSGVFRPTCTAAISGGPRAAKAVKDGIAALRAILDHVGRQNHRFPQMPKRAAMLKSVRPPWRRETQSGLRVILCGSNSLFPWHMPITAWSIWRASSSRALLRRNYV